MLGLILAIILTLFALFFKRSKIATGLLFILMWILFGWNYWNGDYEAYEKIYNESIFALFLNSYETGYILLNIIFKIWEFSFQEFLIVISGFSLLLLCRFVVKYSVYPALFSAIFLWVFLPLDYVLLRNFLAFSIVLQGICSLIDNVKYKYFKFILFIFLASTIHSSSIFYLLILPVIRRETQLKLSVILIAVVGGFVVYLFFGRVLLYNFLKDFGGGRSEFYQTNLITFFSLFLSQVILTNFIVYIYSKFNPEENNFLNSNFYLLIFNINLIALFLIIFYYDFSIFVRLFRHISILNCILITNVLYLLNKEKNGVFLASTLFINIFFIFYLFFFFSYFIISYKDFTIFPLFENNLIF